MNLVRRVGKLAFEGVFLRVVVVPDRCNSAIVDETIS